MAWTAPRTWTDDEVVTAAMLNAHLRGNMLFLSTHQHSGAAGDGASVLAGVDSVTFDHISDPAAPGAAKTILYTKTGAPYIREGAAGGATALSLVGHTHDLTMADSDIQAITGAESVADGSTNAGAVSQALTFTKNDSMAVSHYFGVKGGTTDSWTHKIDGATLDSGNSNDINSVVAADVDAADSPVICEGTWPGAGDNIRSLGCALIEV